MKSRKNRTMVLGILCCLLLIMGVGFAALNTVLNINGIATSINTWDVRMKSIVVSDKTDNVINDQSGTKILPGGETANIKVDFVKPGDYITYEILLENNGTLDAILNDLSINLSSENEGDEQLFVIDTTFPEDKKLIAGESLTFTVTITFDSRAGNLPEGDVKFDVTLDYSQVDGIPEGTEPEKPWDFRVDENGTIISYNYDLGTDVVIPATNYRGEAIKAINSTSFSSAIENYYDAVVDVYINEENSMVVVIDAEEPHFSVVKNKLLSFAENDCKVNNDNQDAINQCIQEYASLEFYKYGQNNLNGYLKYMTVYVNTDPSISWQESIKQSLNATQTNSYNKINNIQPLKTNNKVLMTPSRINSTTNPKLTSLDLSNATNLQTIGSNSFKDMEVTKVTFGNNSNISLIGRNAFSGNKITSLVLPESVTRVDSNAFSDNPLKRLTIEKCSNTVCTPLNFGKELKEVTVNAGEISPFAFITSQVEKVKIGSGVTKIGNSAFVNGNILLLNDNIFVVLDEEKYDEVVSALSNIFSSNELVFYKLSEIPFEVFSLNNDSSVVSNLDLDQDYENFTSQQILELYLTLVFTATSQVSELDLSEASNLKQIGNYAFINSLITHELLIPEGVTLIGNMAFSGSPISGSLNIPNSVVSIGDFSFSNTQINSLTLGSSITEIGESAFYNTQLSGELVIPANLTNIKGNAFSNTQITSLYLPKTVVELGTSAFGGNYFDSLTIENCTLAICKPINRLELETQVTTRSSNVFDSFIDTLTIENGKISDEGFINGQIRNLILGKGVTQIGDKAFSNQRDLNNNPMLESILIDRTESDFLLNVTVGSEWFDKTLITKPTFKQ